MKQKTKKLLMVIALLIIAVGAVLIKTEGLKFDLSYQDNQSVELPLKVEFEKRDIQEITDEIFGNQQVKIQPVEVYQDTVLITTTYITEEQKTNLIAKVNEKYGIELSSDDITINQNTHIQGREIIKNYIKPIAIITAVILVYMMVRFYKLNSIKVLIKAVLTLVLTQGTILAIMVIARLPVGNITMGVVLCAYILSILYCTINFEKQLANNKQEKVTTK